MKKTNVGILDERRLYIQVLFDLAHGICYLYQFRELLNVFFNADTSYQQNIILSDLESYGIIDYYRLDNNQKLVKLTTKATRYITGMKYARAIDDEENAIRLSYYLTEHHLNLAKGVKKARINSGKEFTYILYKNIRIKRNDGTLFRNFEGTRYFKLINKNGCFTVKGINFAELTQEQSLSIKTLGTHDRETIKHIYLLKKRMEDTDKKKKDSISKATKIKISQEEDLNAEEKESKRNIVYNNKVNYIEAARLKNKNLRLEIASNTTIPVDFNALFAKNIYITDIVKTQDNNGNEVYILKVSLFDIWGNYIDEEMKRKINEIDLFINSIYKDRVVIKYDVYSTNLLTSGILGFDVSVHYIEK